MDSKCVNLRLRHASRPALAGGRGAWMPAYPRPVQIYAYKRMLRGA